MIIKLEAIEDGKMKVTVGELFTAVVDKPTIVAVVATPGINLELQKRPQNKL